MKKLEMKKEIFFMGCRKKYFLNRRNILWINVLVIVLLFLHFSHLPTIYHNCGKINLIINGKHTNLDNISIYLGKHEESSIIRNNSFRFKRAYYGDNTFCFIIPANLLLDYKKELEVEFSYYNVVHTVQKQLTLNLNIEVIDRESCQVSYFSKCDIPWILRPILSKDIVPSNTYIEKMVTKDDSFISHKK